MRTTARTRKLSHLLFLVIVWSCVFQPISARRRLPPKAGSWRYLTAGLSDGSLMILGLLVLFACFTLASAASAGAMPNILAVPLVALGVLHFTYHLQQSCRYYLPSKKPIKQNFIGKKDYLY